MERACGGAARAGGGHGLRGPFLAACALGAMVVGGGTGRASAAGLAVAPTLVAGTPGTEVTVWVNAPAGSRVGAAVYGFDEKTGRLSPPGPAAAWLQVLPPHGPAGGPQPFRLRVVGPDLPPPRDAYLDVVFTATGAAAAANRGGRVAAGTLVAFRGAAPAPDGWSARLAGPRLVLWGTGRWDVVVQGAPGGWIAPTVTARLGERTSAVVLPPVLPGTRGRAAVTLRALRPGVLRLSVRVQSGARSVILRRRVWVVPGPAVAGAGAGLGLLALARARRRGTGMRQRGGRGG